MADQVILSVVDSNEAVIETEAARVRTDVVAQYRALAQSLHRKSWDQGAAMRVSSDPAERAARHCAFQLYCAAAAELDEKIAELSESLGHPYSTPTAIETVDSSEDTNSARQAGFTR